MDSECVQNSVNHSLFHCKIEADTGELCGISMNDTSAEGTPIGCKNEADSCQQSSNPLISFCKTKAADDNVCKTTTGI